MLPLNQKQINAYKAMRIGHIMASAAVIPIALYYCKTQGVEFMSTFGFIASLYCMAFLLLFRQYIYPPDLKGAFSLSMGLVVNFLFVIFIADGGIIFSCYYLFFSFLCLQSVVVLGMVAVTLLRKDTNLHLLNHKKMTGKDYRFIALALLAFGSPLIVAPYLLHEPFSNMMNSLDSNDAAWMWVGFIMDILQQLFIIWRIAFAKSYQKEINERQNKLMKDWEPFVNMMFFLGVIGIFIAMIL